MWFKLMQQISDNMLNINAYAEIQKKLMFKTFGKINHPLQSKSSINRNDCTESTDYPGLRILVSNKGR